MGDNPFSVQVFNPLQALLIGQKAYSDGQEANKQQAVSQARQDAVQSYQAGDAKGALSKLLGVGDLQGATALGTQVQNDWTRQHTTTRDTVADQHWATSDKRAAAAEGRSQYEFDHTPDQYAPNPRANEPGQPKFIDQYAAAKAAGEASVPAPDGGVKSLTPGGELYHLEGGKVVVDHKN